MHDPCPESARLGTFRRAAREGAGPIHALLIGATLRVVGAKRQAMPTARGIMLGRQRPEIQLNPVLQAVLSLQAASHLPGYDAVGHTPRRCRSSATSRASA